MTHLCGIKMPSNVGRLMRVRCILLLILTFSAVILIENIGVLLSGSDSSADMPGFKGQDQQQACRHPNLDVMNPLIKKHIREVGELKCNREDDWISTRRGVAVIPQAVVDKHGSISCKITYIARVDDFNTKHGKSVSLTSQGGPVALEDDFFVAKCQAEDKTQWKNLMAAIHRNESLAMELRKVPQPEKSMKLNVLMYGLDSMSRMHFIRKLPKTYKYLTEDLKAFVLKGYNIVGDGTPQALIPILTGSTEEALPETRKRIAGAQHVDVYPFAWKNFRNAGYATAWGEEQPSVGTFTYRLKGFKHQPTDHYMRSFYLKVDELWKNHPKLCLANKPRHTLMLDWLRDFYEVYPDIPKFGFCFNSELSHDDYNLIGHADPDIEGFLRNLHYDGSLNNTFLIVMSDHGHRFAPIRASQQGKQEERMPFFSIILPPWMRARYPDMVKNLEINQNRLVTPFDIHATFMTLLDPDIPQKGKVDQRSISLFSEIPKERTCESASIETHWCACLAWSPVSAGSDEVRKIGQAVVNFMNALTDFQRTKCVELTLDKVTRVEKLTPNKELLTFRKNADHDGRRGEFSDNTAVTEVVYQVQVVVLPSRGVYEAIVKYDVLGDVFLVKEDELSRVNVYGNQEHCVHDQHPQLRKYCYCKVQLKQSNDVT